MTHQVSHHSAPIDLEAEGKRLLQNFANHLPSYAAAATQRN